MAHWLLKTEPSDYSYDDLVADRKVTWDGVSNATALKHLRAMQKGDDVLVYHTGAEKQVVGVAEVTKGPYPDPKAGDEKLVVVDLKPGRKLARPVTLVQIRSDKAFNGWDLLRIGRLSVVPVPEPMWVRIEQLSGVRS